MNHFVVATETLTQPDSFSVADALRKFAPAYLAKFDGHVPLRHRKVLSLIGRCQTGALGNAFYQCGSCGDQHVVYRVKPSGKQQYRSKRVSGEQFVRSFAQHILPSGFQKVRYYGFMSPNCKVQLEDVRWLAWIWKGWTYWLGSAMFQPVIKKPITKCSSCGGELALLFITNEQGRVIGHRASPKRGPPSNR